MELIGKVVLAGGTGFLGSVLAEHFRHTAREIVILSRSAHQPHHNVTYRQWDGKTVGEWASAIDGADLLVSLSGKNVNCRYTADNMREIYASRLEPTQALAEAVAAAEQPPRVWVHLTSATIYRHAEDRAQDEETGELGSGFSIDVCRTWENAFEQVDAPNTRKVMLRVGLVLGPHDGVFPRLKNLVRCGFGGAPGNGRQMMSWIHQDDVARAVEWAFHHGRNGAIYNATAPGAVTSREFMRELRTSYGIPVGFPMPQWMLEIGAYFIRTEVELILKSRWVYPRRLLEEGFTFSFPDAPAAIADILWRR